MKPWTFVANLRTDSRGSLARRSREHAVEPRDDGMKFAKVLKAEMVHEWEDMFINYKVLKKLLNSVRAGATAMSDVCGDDGSDLSELSDFGDDDDDIFGGDF